MGMGMSSAQVYNELLNKAFVQEMNKVSCPATKAHKGKPSQRN